MAREGGGNRRFLPGFAQASHSRPIVVVRNRSSRNPLLVRRDFSYLNGTDQRQITTLIYEAVEAWKAMKQLERATVRDAAVVELARGLPLLMEQLDEALNGRLHDPLL